MILVVLSIMTKLISQCLILFDCKFPMDIWKLVKQKVYINHEPGHWFDIIDELQNTLKMKNIGNFIKKYETREYYGMKQILLILWFKELWRIL